MRIRLETAGRAPFWLVGDPALNEREVTEAMQPMLQITRQQQSVAGAGQDITEHFDRGNQKVVLEASSFREFDSEFDRMDFLARLAPTNRDDLLHEWTGDAWIRLTRRDGSNAFREWEMPGVVVALAGTEIKGEVGLSIRYRITAGGFGDARDGTSELALLLGSEDDAFGMILSVSGLSELLSPTYGPTTTGFRLEIERGTPPALASLLLLVSGASESGEFDLPFASCAEDVAEWLADAELGGGMTFEVDGDEFRILDPPPWWGYITMRIYHRWTDPYYGPQEALMLEQGADIIPGAEFRLLGTTGVEEQLTGLIQD